MKTGLFLVVAALALGADDARSAPPAPLRVWRFLDGRVTPEDGADEPRGVGSLQKAWLVAAWAESHPEAPLPRLVCTRESRCWLAKGHGAVELRSATARSCNAYFRALAAETPSWRIVEAFRRAGFALEGPPTPDAATGPEPGSVLVAPAALLSAYAALVRTPWVLRDDARREWLLGMRDAAMDGTAARFPLRGLLAKTGTVSSAEPLGTSGWAIALDPSGASGALAYLARGTGADAAAALGATLLEERPWASARGADEMPRRASPVSFAPARARAEERAAAVRRFLAKGARHGTEDVCDLSHCARFVGLGPELVWERPTHARVVPTATQRFTAPIDDAMWSRATRASKMPGPSTWYADCGGEPLSERAVWGSGSSEALACRHHPSPAPP